MLGSTGLRFGLVFPFLSGKGSGRAAAAQAEKTSARVWLSAIVCYSKVSILRGSTDVPTGRAMFDAYT